FALDGQLEFEAGAPLRPISGKDRTVVLLQDAPRYGEAEAGSLARRLGGEEGLEKARQGFGRDSRPAVLDGDAHGATGRRQAAGGSRGDAHHDAAAATDRVDRVEKEIQHDLRDLLAVSHGARQVGGDLLLERDLAVAGAVVDERAGAAHHLAD